jgi:aminopeptidase N
MSRTGCRRWQIGLTVLLLTFIVSACRTIDVTEDATVPSDTTIVVIEEAEEAGNGYVVMDMGLDEFEPRVRSYDVIHTALDLRFDFPNEVLNGMATHRLSPLSDGLDTLHFDAADMDIHHVILRHSDGFADTLVFRYVNQDLTALLVEPLAASDTVEVSIEYAAHPNRSEQVLGLHFVDGPGVDASNPTQVWTLSQPEDGRYWFPHWDYPNDFMTFEIALTVPQSMKAFANGVLTESSNVGGGLRRDVWLLEQPHVSYLTAIAVGEFAIVSDTLHRADGTYIPLQYIVEPEFAPHAHLVFGETPRMLEVLENRTGVRYPWPNYRQVAVREFTAGGMEHTTLSTMTSTLQHDPRAHLDYTGRDLIAHEAIHQWFGNLLTGQDWAHLSINEGFASYFEEVYLEDAHGVEKAQEHAISDLNTYLAEAQRYRRPIIWYGYEDPYQQYDRHTYQKAARVLNQLRFELGEEAWWSGIRRFTRENQHRNVNAGDLRRAMEVASSRDLEWFFDQWFHSPGHPELLVTQSFDDVRGLYSIRVRQTHDTTSVPVFRFDADFVVHYAEREPYVERVTVTTADTTFRIATAGEIAFVRFDHGNELLADITVEKPLDEWISQSTRSSEMAARYHAVRNLAARSESEGVAEALMGVLNDRSDYVRMHAAQALSAHASRHDVQERLVRGVSTDASSRVRNAAIVALRGEEDVSGLRQILADALRDSSYVVTATAAAEYARRYPSEAAEALRPLFELQSWRSTVETALVGALAPLADDAAFGYIASRLEPQRPALERAAAVRALPAALSASSGRHSQVTQLLDRAMSDVNVDVRLTAARVAADERLTPQRTRIEGLLVGETSERVRAALQTLLEPGIEDDVE